MQRESKLGSSKKLQNIFHYLYLSFQNKEDNLLLCRNLVPNDL